MIEDRDRPYDESRYKALIHHVCHRVGAANLGSTKLNKILLEVDREAYLRNSQSITGVRYEKQNYGPVPRNLPSVRSALAKEGKISYQPSQHQFAPDVIESLVEPDVGIFSDEEMELINAMTDRVAVYTSTAASERTHTDTWKLARDRAVIPHQAWLADSIVAPHISSVSALWAMTAING